jgi:hypothetical protein
MSDFSHGEQAKRLYGLDAMERKALDVLGFIVQQTERGRNVDAALLERAKAIVEKYDRVMKKGLSTHLASFRFVATAEVIV